MMPPANTPATPTELIGYLNLFRRKAPWILAITVATLVIGTLYSLTQAVSYSATAQVLVKSGSFESTNNPGIAERNLGNEITYAGGDAVTETVASKTDREIDIEISRDEENEDSDTLWFSADSGTPDLAAQDANLWAQSYVETKSKDNQQSIAAAINILEKEKLDLQNSRDLALQSTPINPEDTEVAVTDTQVKNSDTNLLDSQISLLNDKISDLKITSTLSVSNSAEVIKEAQVPKAPSSNSLSKILLISLLIGTILGLITAIALDQVDSSIKDISDLEMYGVPTIGVIPSSKGKLSNSELSLAVMSHPNSEVAEAYQKIRASIEFAKSENDFNSLLVVSPGANEGKTTSAVNIAWTLGSVQNRVVIADTNFRKPDLHNVFGCTSEPGITNYVLDHTPLKQVALKIADEKSNLIVLPSGYGPPSAGAFLASAGFSKLLTNLKTQADIVVLDSPPILPYSDALALASKVDRVLIVVRAGKTKKKELGTSISALNRVGAKILGICVVDGDLNNWNSQIQTEINLNNKTSLDSFETKTPFELTQHNVGTF